MIFLAKVESNKLIFNLIKLNLSAFSAFCSHSTWMQLNLVNLVKITESSINNPFKLFS